MKIKAIILDDEPLAVNLIEDYARKVPGIKVVYAGTNVFEAINCLKSEEIDLIFIDIQMPELTGMEFMQMFSNYNFIITTAYPNYALDAFNFKVIDFLLKPVTFQRFYKSIDKFLNWKEQKSEQFLFVKADRKFHKIYFDKIVYVEGLRDYIRIHTDDEKVMVLENMRDFQDKLPQKRFVRVHRSFILALDRIKTIEGNRIILQNDKDIPIGETYKKFVHQWLE